MADQDKTEQGSQNQGNDDLKSEVMDSFKSFQAENNVNLETDNSASQAADEQRASSDSEKTGSEEKTIEVDSEEKTNQQVSSASEREAKKSRSQIKVEKEIAERNKEKERADRAEQRAQDLERRLADQEQRSRQSQEKERPRYFYKEPPNKPKLDLIKDENFILQHPRADIEFELRKAAGDEQAEAYWGKVLREYDQLVTYDREFTKWQSNEGQHKKLYDDRKAHFDNILQTDPKFAWVKDNQSEQGKVLTALIADQNKADLVEFLRKQPEGFYLMAEWALDRAAANRSGALETRVKELESKQAQKAPIASGDGAEDVGIPAEEDDKDPKKSLFKNLKSYKENNPGRSLSFAK